MLTLITHQILPVLDSTRSLYRKKLAITMRELLNEKSNGETHLIENLTTNGISHDGELQNGEYSADDEEVLDTAQGKDNSEDEQPSLVIRPSVTPTPTNNEGKRISTRSASKSSSISKAKAALSEVRQRFSGISANPTL